MEIIIRQYEEKYEKEFKQSIIDLQNYELAFDSEMLSGEATVDAWFQHVLEENKQKEGRIFIAEVDGKAVGFISLRIELKGEQILLPDIKSVLISDFIIHPEFRGKGIGKQLLQKAEEYAKEKNIKYIKLSVFAANTNAKDIYKNLGFKEYSVTMLKRI